uniref:R13L1/DRL21-like LRR repeat region domain-containing protein n=1 Tax=Opuntia streptacantha TaxID=393608 RepID=A0A7C9ARK1_OPUST
MKNLSSLKALTIWDCGRATSLQNLEYLTSLQCLQLSWCSEMENLPDIRSLICLEDLTISSCIKMTCLPVGLSNLSNLKTLEIGPLSPNMRIFPFPNLNHLSPLSASLRNLDINAYEMDKVENLPNQIQHLRQLRSLKIGGFKNLKELPEWLGKLTSLERLHLTKLPLVEHLPSQAATECLSQLTWLNVDLCPLLEKACRTPNGSEWAKIQKVHHVRFFEGFF